MHYRRLRKPDVDQTFWVKQVDKGFEFSIDGSTIFLSDNTSKVLIDYLLDPTIKVGRVRVEPNEQR